MAKIRSALEIALEKTESVKEDPEKIRQQRLEERGKRLFSSYFFEGQKDTDDIAEKISSESDEDRPLVLRGYISTLLSNINLPKNELYVEELGWVKKAAEIVAVNTDELQEQFVQLDRFFQQYLQQKEQLKEALESRYAPKLQEKQQKLAQQFGQTVELTPEQDPEFMELLGRNVQQMDQQYQGVLEEIKDKIRSLLKTA